MKYLSTKFQIVATGLAETIVVPLAEWIRYTTISVRHIFTAIDIDQRASANHGLLVHSSVLSVYLLFILIFCHLCAIKHLFDIYIFPWIKNLNIIFGSRATYS